MSRLTDEDADEWRSFRFGPEPAPIAEDDFNAEQDAIEAARARAEAEYARVNGGRCPGFPVDPLACLCRRCMGATLIALSNADTGAIVWQTCPDCFGWGVEGPFILETPAVDAVAYSEAAE